MLLVLTIISFLLLLPLLRHLCNLDFVNLTGNGQEKTYLWKLLGGAGCWLDVGIYAQLFGKRGPRHDVFVMLSLVQCHILKICCFYRGQFSNNPLVTLTLVPTIPKNRWCHCFPGISLEGKTTLEVMGALNDSIEIPGRDQVGFFLSGYGVRRFVAVLVCVFLSLGNIEGDDKIHNLCSK